MKKKLFLLMALLACLAVFSANVYAACTSTVCYGKIERVYVNGSTFFISTDGNENLLNCTAPNGIYVTMSTADPNFKNLYAMMLTSMSSDFNIGIRIVEGSPSCSILYTYMDNN